MPVPETIELGRGVAVEIRATTADDADALCAFYERFSQRDRYLRFFSAFTPSATWCRSWATVADRGGFGLIAIAHGPDGDEVIAEAGYALQSDGDAELAVAVVPEWRGWLGSYLVELLVQQAARSDIKNLQAEVLLENRPMLALLRHRGAADREHPGGVVRMSIGTVGDLPDWPSAESRRKLLVATGSGRWSGERDAADQGWATTMCRGPSRRGRGGCPVVRGEACPLADGADAIVVMLDPAADETASLVAALRRRRPGIPILAVPPDEGSGELPDGCVAVGATGSETFARVLSLVGMSPESG